jgi:hypothetical protein
LLPANREDRREDRKQKRMGKEQQLQKQIEEASDASCSSGYADRSDGDETTVV